MKLIGKIDVFVTATFTISFFWKREVGSLYLPPRGVQCHPAWIWHGWAYGGKDRIRGTNLQWFWFVG